MKVLNLFFSTIDTFPSQFCWRSKSSGHYPLPSLKVATCVPPPVFTDEPWFSLPQQHSFMVRFVSVSDYTLLPSFGGFFFFFPIYVFIFFDVLSK